MDESRSTSSNVPPNPVLNKQLGERYDVLEKLGEGPLVVAYRGRDRTLNRLVSVKMLLPAFSQNHAVRDRLRNGLGRTLALSSPRIVRAYDVGNVESGGQSLLFWVEEYVRGINLKERIRRAAPFQLAAAIDAVIVLGEALEYAHSRGIPHGDLRPQNVLIGSDGEMKLTGFAIADAQAIAIREEPNLIRRIDSYSPPESTPGALASQESDLYALGVILFELLTGELPPDDTGETGNFPGPVQPTFAARLQNTSIPRTIQGIVEKATMIRPMDRYQSATAILADLKAVRDSLRYGKGLTWSPLDTQPLPDSNAAVKTDVRTPSADSDSAPPTERFAPSAEIAKNTGSASEPTLSMTVPVFARQARPSSDIRFVGESNRSQSAPVDDRYPSARAERERDEEEKDERPLRRDNQQGDNSGGGGNRYLTSLNLFLFVLVVAGLGVLGFMTTSFLRPAPEVVVPNLVGRTTTDAKEMASEQKFDLAVVDEQYRESDASGVIYQMQPAPGRHIREGKPISIWVSKGPRMVDVPDVRSMTLEKARQTIESNNLKLGDYTFQYDAVEPKGNVLSQDPPAGDSRPHGTHIVLVLSKGEEPAPTPIPDVPTPLGTGPDPTPSPSDTPTSSSASPTPAPVTTDTESRVRTFDIKYPVPADGAEHRIRIDVTDRDGTRTVFDETHKTGETVKQRIEAVGKQIHIRLFDNDQIRSELVK